MSASCLLGSAIFLCVHNNHRTPFIGGFNGKIIVRDQLIRHIKLYNTLFFMILNVGKYSGPNTVVIGDVVMSSLHLSNTICQSPRLLMCMHRFCLHGRSLESSWLVGMASMPITHCETCIFFTLAFTNHCAGRWMNRTTHLLKRHFVSHCIHSSIVKLAQYFIMDRCTCICLNF